MTAPDRETGPHALVAVILSTLARAQLVPLVAALAAWLRALDAAASMLRPGDDAARDAAERGTAQAIARAATEALLEGAAVTPDTEPQVLACVAVWFCDTPHDLAEHIDAGDRRRVARALADLDAARAELLPGDAGPVEGGGASPPSTGGPCCHPAMRCAPCAANDGTENVTPHGDGGALRALAVDVAAYLADHYDVSTAGVAEAGYEVCRLLAGAADAHGLLYLASALAELLDVAATNAACGPPPENTPVRAGCLAESLTLATLVTRVLALAAAEADRAHPGWRERPGDTFSLGARLRPFDVGGAAP